MCQLTYSNLRDPYQNSLMIYLLGKIGSEKHDDGVGFICSDNKIWKSEVEANKITNLGNIININLIDNKPIPFHIRSATYGIAVTKENAHPFDGKHYILMHNGTLLPRNGEEPKDKKNDSDSLRFLKALDECKDINPSGSFQELLTGAMSNFAGKFAFIIRDKETNIDYIIRGRTAELWISDVLIDGKKTGYVINTSKETMEFAFHEFINIWDLFFPENISFSKPTLLDMESIFEAGDLEISKIGSIKEVTPVKETSITPYQRVANRSARWDSNWEDETSNDEAKDIAKKAEKIYEFLSDHSLVLLDFQLLVMIAGGVSILELTEEDLEMFINYIIPKISADTKIRKQIKNILNGQSFPQEVYDNYPELEYPWTVNKSEVVIKALKEYSKTI